MFDAVEYMFYSLVHDTAFCSPECAIFLFHVVLYSETNMFIHWVFGRFYYQASDWRIIISFSLHSLSFLALVVLKKSTFTYYSKA